MYRTITLTLILALTPFTAFAQKKGEQVNFSRDVVVAGTQLKRGSYRAIYDAQTQELTLMESGKVVARTSAKLQKRNNRASRAEVHFKQQGSEVLLVGITFAGATDSIVVETGSGLHAAKPQQ